MPILTSLSPNTEPDDVLLAIKTLVTPWRWRNNKVSQSVINELERRLPAHHATLVSSGRAAIYHLLKAQGIGQGDEVIIQAFTCLAVPAPIQWTGATPIYADISPQTYNLDPTDVARKITPRTRAIIIQHTFGIPGPIKELQRLASQHNLLLIEDLAHSFGGVLPPDKGGTGGSSPEPLGTFGHAAILSFGRDKTISCTFGGAIVSQNKKLIQVIEKHQQTLPHPPSWWIAQQLLHPIMMGIIVKPLYFTFNIGKALLIAAQKAHFLSMAVTSDEKRGLKPPFINWRFSPALAILLHNQLKKLTHFTTRRQQIVRQYQKQLQNQNLQLGPLLRSPLEVAERDKLLRKALRNRLMFGDWYTQPVRPSATTHANVSGYQPGSCPHAEQAAKRIINLPTYPTMNDEDVAKVIAFIKQAGAGTPDV